MVRQRGEAALDDSEGDVYRCVLKAVAADPPRLSLPYDELNRANECDLPG